MKINRLSESAAPKGVATIPSPVAKGSSARLGTLDELIQSVIPNFIVPLPSKDTLRAWFDGANIYRFKANPEATRGGGPVYYSIAGVEKFLRQRTLPRRVRMMGQAASRRRCQWNTIPSHGDHDERA